MNLNLKFKLRGSKKPKDIAHFSYTNINTTRDWYAILAIFLIVNLIGVVFSSYLFYSLNNRPTPENNGAIKTNNEQDSRLQRVVSVYNSKHQAFEKTLESKPVVQDPSF